LVRDAREHGVEVRAPDAWESDWDCTLEEAFDGRDDPLFPPPCGEGERGGGSSGQAVPPQTECLRDNGSMLVNILDRTAHRRAPHPPSPSPQGGGGSAPPSRRKAVRLGLRLVGGLAEAEAEKLVVTRKGGAESLEALARGAGLARGVLERIAEA